MWNSALGITDIELSDILKVNKNVKCTCFQLGCTYVPFCWNNLLVMNWKGTFHVILRQDLSKIKAYCDINISRKDNVFICWILGRKPALIRVEFEFLNLVCPVDRGIYTEERRVLFVLKAYKDDTASGTCVWLVRPIDRVHWYKLVFLCFKIQLGICFVTVFIIAFQCLKKENGG